MRLFRGQPGGIIGASILLAVFGLASRVVGLVRDRILASSFGASDILDVYYISFGVPDFIFNIIVAGAISSALIPIFIEYSARSSDEARRLINNFLNHAFACVAFLILAAFWLAPYLIGFIAPGFEGGKKELAVLFMRIMLFSPLIFTVSMVIGSVLQANKKFFTYALAPIAYNIGIIIGALWFVPWFGPLGLAEGVVLGAGLHLAIQLFGLKGTNFRWQFVWEGKDKGLSEIYRMMVPRALGLGFYQIGWVALNAFATMISTGAVAVFNFAYNIHYLPIALVGISVATAYFPELSADAVKKPKDEVAASVTKYLRYSLFILLPVVSFAILFRNEIIAVILKSGLFGGRDAETTASVLGLLLIGVPAQSAISLLARVFYAFKNSLTPALTGILAIIILIAAGWFAAPVFGIKGLAIIFSSVGITQSLILLFSVKRYLPEFRPFNFIGYGFFVLIPSFVTVFILWLIRIPSWFSNTFFGDVFTLLSAMIAGGVIFLLLSKLMKIGESDIFSRTGKPV